MLFCFVSFRSKFRFYVVVWFRCFRFGSVRFGSVRFGSVRFGSVRFVLVPFVRKLFGFALFGFASFRFVSFRFVSFRFVSFRFVSFVSFRFLFDSVRSFFDSLRICERSFVCVCVICFVSCRVVSLIIVPCRVASPSAFPSSGGSRETAYFLAVFVSE